MHLDRGYDYPKTWPGSPALDSTISIFSDAKPRGTLEAEIPGAPLGLRWVAEGTNSGCRTTGSYGETLTAGPSTATPNSAWRRPCRITAKLIDWRQMEPRITPYPLGP